MEAIEKGTLGRKRRRGNAAAASEDEAREVFRTFKLRLAKPEPEPPNPEPAPSIPAAVTFAQHVAKNGSISRKRTPLSDGSRAVEASSLNLKFKTNPREGGILDSLGDVALVSLTAQMVDNYARLLLDLGFNAYTVNSRLRLIRKICSHAAENLDIAVPALRKWPSKEKEVPLENELSKDEADRLLKVFRSGVIEADNPRVAAYRTAMFRESGRAFVLALTTGLSKADLFALTWSHVNLTEGVIEIERRKTEVLSTVALTPLLREVLDECRQAHPFASQVLHGIPEIRVRKDWAVAKRMAGIERRCLARSPALGGVVRAFRRCLA